MDTVRERYLNDSKFRALVDTLEAQIHMAEFSPSEVRLAAMQACINYEMRRMPRTLFPANVESAIETLEDWTSMLKQR